MKEQYRALIKEWEEARGNFMYYALSMTYGDQRDHVYNFERAESWERAIKEIRAEIITEMSKGK